MITNEGVAGVGEVGVGAGVDELVAEGWSSAEVAALLGGPVVHRRQHPMASAEHSWDASRRQEFLKLRLLRAVIAEFVGADAGLGFLIVQSGAGADTSLPERKLLPWAEEHR